MGIHTGIRNTVLKTLLPHAFEEVKDHKSLDNGVVIWDILTFLHAAFNLKVPSSGDMFTGQQLGWWLKHTLSKQMNQPGCKVGVVSMDNGLFTPQEKKTEQRRRTKNRSSNPYPQDAKFAVGGIYFGSADPATAIPFNIRRVMSTRGAVRAKLWNYLCTYLTENWYGRQEMLILDRAGDDPYIYVNNQWGRETGTSHSYGEADLATTYWLERLWDQGYSNFYILSTDSDMICTTLAFMRHKNVNERSPNIHLRYWRRKADGLYLWMNMGPIWHFLTHSKDWTPYTFIMFCCLCGTDFTDPKQTRRPQTTEQRALFHCLAVQHIWDAWVEFSLSRYCHHALSHLSVFRRLVRAVYSHVFTTRDIARGAWFTDSTTRQRFLATLEQMQKKNQLTRRPFTFRFIRRMGPRTVPKVHFPTDRELTAIQGQLQFNMNYWTPAPSAPPRPVKMNPKTVIVNPLTLAIV